MIKNWKGVGSFGTVGLEIVLGIVIGLLGGRWLDNKFHTAPYLMVAGFFLGLITGVRALLRAWNDMKRETEREEREEGNPSPLFDDAPPDDKDASPESPRRKSPPPEGPPSEKSDDQRR